MSDQVTGSSASPGPSSQLATGNSGGTTTPAESGSSPSGTATATGTTPPPKSYSEKVAAARAKAAEAPKADPKGASSGAAGSGKNTGSSSTTGTASSVSSNSSASTESSHGAGEARTESQSDDTTERLAEMARAARSAREERAAAKKEKEEAKVEREAIAKEREEIAQLREVKKLLADGNVAGAWKLFAADKAADPDAFSEIAKLVAGDDSALTKEEMRKEVREALKEAKDDEAEAERKKAERAKEKEREEREAAETTYYECDDPKDPNYPGVIPLYKQTIAKAPDKYPAIQKLGASREFMKQVAFDETKARKFAETPTPAELLDAIEKRLQDRVDKEAKAMGYEKPQPKKPPAAQSGRGGSPDPVEVERRPGESAYAAKVRAARAALRGET